MVSIKDITEALKNQLIAANTDNKAYTIVRNAVENKDISRAIDGWIGIYRNGRTRSPYATGNTWMVEIKIDIIIQAASGQSAEDCEAKMDALQEFVENAIDADRTIGGKVNMITEYDWQEDFDYSDGKLVTYFQATVLTITAEVLDR